MKDDGSAKELEKLLQESLKASADSARGKVPIHQLKTLPLPIHIPPASSGKELAGETRESTPELAKILAPDSLPPPPPAAMKPAKPSAARKLAWVLLLIPLIGAGILAWRTFG